MEIGALGFESPNGPWNATDDGPASGGRLVAPTEPHRGALPDAALAALAAHAGGTEVIHKVKKDRRIRVDGCPRQPLEGAHVGA